MSDNVTKLNEQMTVFAAEYTKFMEKNNKSAGQRARAALLDIKKITGELRKEISERKNSL